MSIYPSLLLRDSFRYWMRKPWQALLCVGLLAAGTAAVALLWTITDGVVRKPLPFPDSHELYGLQSVDEKSGKRINFMALADFRDFRERQTSFEGMFAYRGDFLNYREPGGTTRQVFASRVTRDFAQVLRVTPLLGRVFEGEDFASEESGVAMVSYAFWQREMGGKTEAVGQSLWFNDRSFQVIGIMPKSYKEPAFADVWTPFPDVTGEYFVRDSRYWSVVGRLKPGVTLEMAGEEAKSIAAALAAEYPATNRSRSARLETMQTMVVGDFSTPLKLILAAVSLVMFATCLNLANLQLISGLQRRGEVGIRQAIGESQHQAFARVLMESVVICVVGCGLGGALAAYLIVRMDRVMPEMFLPRLHEISLSGSLVWTILAIALGASVGFGLLPALQAARTNTNEILKSGEARHGLSAEGRRSRTALLSLQIAVAVLILHGALLVVYEYKRLKGVDIGFREDNLVMITVSPEPSRMFDLMGLGAYYDEVLGWLAEQDGVQAATSASSPPLWGFDMESVFQVQGQDLAAQRDEAVMAGYNSVSLNYLDTMGIKVINGRGFGEWDNRESQRVALVNKAFVEEYLGGLDPLGQQVQVQSWMEPRFRQIVGVVGDYSQVNLTDAPKPQIFVPATQTPWVFTTMMARTKELPQSWREQLESEMKQKYPDLGITVSTMDDLMDRHLAIQSVMYGLFVGFGSATLALSLFGLGSQMAFNVSERRREWGIRLALGAQPSQLNTLVARKLLVPLGAGIGAGLVLFAASYKTYGHFGQTLDGRFALTSVALLAGIVLAGSVTAWLVSSRITRASPQDILKSL